MGLEEFFMQMQDMIEAFAPLIPVLLGLVEFYKICGLPSDGPAIIASVITGIVLALAVQASILYPVVGTWFLTGLVGAIIGMSATGLYTIGSRWAGKIGGNV